MQKSKKNRSSPLTLSAQTRGLGAEVPLGATYLSRSKQVEPFLVTAQFRFSVHSVQWSNYGLPGQKLETKADCRTVG
jgi:hypothetical protein